MVPDKRVTEQVQAAIRKRRAQLDDGAFQSDYDRESNVRKLKLVEDTLAVDPVMALKIAEMLGLIDTRGHTQRTAALHELAGEIHH